MKSKVKVKASSHSNDENTTDDGWPRDAEEEVQVASEVCEDVPGGPAKWAASCRHETSEETGRHRKQHKPGPHRKGRPSKRTHDCQRGRGRETAPHRRVQKVPGLAR